jgi:hypothetical protein
MNHPLLSFVKPGEIKPFHPFGNLVIGKLGNSDFDIRLGQNNQAEIVQRQA